MQQNVRMSTTHVTVQRNFIIVDSLVCQDILSVFTWFEVMRIQTSLARTRLLIDLKKLFVGFPRWPKSRHPFSSLDYLSKYGATQPRPLPAWIINVLRWDPHNELSSSITLLEWSEPCTFVAITPRVFYATIFSTLILPTSFKWLAIKSVLHRWSRLVALRDLLYVTVDFLLRCSFVVNQGFLRHSCLRCMYQLSRCNRTFKLLLFQLVRIGVISCIRMKGVFCGSRIHS